MEAEYPSAGAMFDALGVIGHLLDVRVCHLIGSSYYFHFEDESALSVTPESAGRIRFDLWTEGRTVCSIWTHVEDFSRLERSVLELAEGRRSLVT